MRADAELPARRPWSTVLTLVAIVAVVAIFVGVTVIGQRYARDIDALTRGLTTDAPSIERLSAARGALRRLTIETRDALRAAEGGGTPDGRSLEATRKALDTAIADYVALPPYPRERELQRAVLAAVDEYRRALDLVLERIDRGELAAAHQIVAARFMPASDQADRAIEKLEWVDADYASRTATSIKAARRKATRFAYGLAALAAAAALLVMGSVWWANRSFAAMADARARLEAVRKRLAEQRASELEMFAGRVAHDLRNPLAAIALRVAVAQRDAHDPARVQTCLHRVITVVEHATQMIDGLLDFARAGGATDPSAHVDACQAIRSVLDDLEPEIDDAGITVTTEMPAGAELRCRPGALLSVVGNLVRNAIKYAAGDGEGRITIRVAESASCVRVEVEDSGPGIPPDDAGRMFEPFVRGTVSGEPGIGLGLATVKRIVEAHGGRVGVRPVEPHGCCFWLELPRPTSRIDAMVPSSPDAHA